MVRMHFYHRFGILRLCRDCSSKYNVHTIYEKKSSLFLECEKKHCLKEEFPVRNNKSIENEIIELTSIRYRLHSSLGGGAILPHQSFRGNWIAKAFENIQ